MLSTEKSFQQFTFSWSHFWFAYLFFFYFSGFYQLFLYLSHQSGFNGFRQTVYMSFLWLIPLILFPRQTKSLSAIFGIILWSTSLVLIGYYAVYGQNFSQSVLFILFESNISEGSEYLESYFSWWIVLGFFIYTALAVFLWTKIKPLHSEATMRMALTISILAIVAWPTYDRLLVKHSTLKQALHAQMNRMEPAAPWHLIAGYIKYKEQLHDIEQNLLANKKLPPLQGLHDNNNETSNTLVLVIGESTNRQRMSLYGYHRPTTPQLDAMKDDLIIFDQVFSPRPYTIETLEQVLSFADEKNPDVYLSRPTLMNLMKQAGYRTYWITNQQTQTKRNTMLTTFSKQADEQIYLNNDRNQNSAHYDDVVLRPFKAILENPKFSNKNDQRKKFIVIHLLGTHRKYSYRYPEDSTVFQSNKDLPKWLNESQVEEYNAYDNAIHFNDLVLSGLINTLKESGNNGFLAYLSDHGEEVYDNSKRLFTGRNEAAPTGPMYTIPFFVWQSDSWKKKHHSKLDVEKVVHRFYSSSDFIYTWTDLAGIDFKDFDATRSIVNADFTKHPIWIGDPNKPKSLRDLRKEPFLARPEIPGKGQTNLMINNRSQQEI
ncbi:phosphoethanolamine transferase CptA [sulfur-oxidizing endosymbiont of Gigantopelta aegis]|uniref:phosphoethanolamine transferase CptA n=1 Tax=sulfur-oxidizing endosymbiont of Gigantopelta aegis TaxID=2794934 RepID=UPI0018DE0FD2|nr:phosphoethanolamine transferase CptA [sulfur-oxidizing endosymbiont of Gigantopelta aegis]